MDTSTMPTVHFKWREMTVTSGIITTREQAEAFCEVILTMANRLYPREAPKLEAVRK